MRDHAIGVFVALHMFVIITLGFGHAGDLSGPWQVLPDAWNAYQGVNHKITRLYGDLLGPKQSWAMFAGVARVSARTQVEIRTAEGWRVVYQERSDEHDWRRATFEHYRYRELFGVLGRFNDPGPIFQEVSAWLANEALEDFPEACAARVRVLESPALTADQMRAGARRPFATLRRKSRVVRTERPCR